MESKKNFGNHTVKNTTKNIDRLRNDGQLILGQDTRMCITENQLLTTRVFAFASCRVGHSPRMHKLSKVFDNL